MKKKIVNLVPVICYALQSFAGLVLAIVMYSIGIDNKEQPIAKFFLAIISVLFLAIGVVYFVVGIIPFGLRALTLFRRSRGMIIACMVFDIIYIAISSLMLSAFFFAGSIAIGIAFVLLAILSGVSFGMNIVSIDKGFNL